MSSLDLDQVLYARAAWRKSLLVPLWTFQVVVLLCLMGIFAYRLAETFEHYEELDRLGSMPIVEVVWEATNVGFNLIALVLTILEIARKATERLTPFTMVASHVIKLTLSFAVLALDIVAYLQRIDGHYSTVGLSLDCGLLAATLASFTYSVLTYRRLLKYEDYHLTANAKAHGFIPGGTAAVELGYNKLGHQTAGITTTTTTELRFSDRTSYQPPPPGSSYIRPYPGPTTTTSNPPSPPPPSGTTTITGEEAEAKALKTEVDRAISVEFGWRTPPASTSDNLSVGTGSEAVSRSSSVVLGGGTVPVHHGGLVAVPEEGAVGVGVVSRQGSFVGVVASHGGDGRRDVRGRGEEEDNDDQEALLPKR